VPELNAPQPAIASPTPWQAASVERITAETYRAKTFTLRLSEPRPFRAGQHYDVRLTAPDGYQAQRSYSIASAPPPEISAPVDTIDLTVELIPDGEVSPYFHEVVQPGDELEVRGPIGGPFTWSVEMGGPLLLLAGGSGIVPLRSILAHRDEVAPDLPALLLYSSRSPGDIIYRKWLESADERTHSAVVRHTFTRQQPADWRGFARRVDAPMLTECLGELAGVAGAGIPLCYACGPTGFVEAAADALLEVGLPEERIHTERFGPTG
jgi:ferredoxin-NADP reductase